MASESSIGPKSTGLFIATTQHYPLAVKDLIRRGANVNVQGGSDKTPLHIAVQNGFRSITSLLASHPNINPYAKTFKGATPLYYAAKCDDPVAAEILIKKTGLSVNQPSVGGKTALHAAAQVGSQDTVQLLLEHNADPSIKDNKGRTAADLAADYEIYDTIENW